MTNKQKHKKTLIVAATYEEVGPTFVHFGWPKANFVEHIYFDVLITGVGMTATAFALGQRLNEAYGLVLNVGIAGSFDKTIELGRLVKITEDTFSELGAEDGKQFLPLEALGFGKTHYRSSFEMQDKALEGLRKAKGITVNTVHGEPNHITELLARLDVDTESMEGAAVFYACECLDMPALQIRSISNYVEQGNKEHWKIGLAIKNLNDWLIKFLNAKLRHEA